MKKAKLILPLPLLLLAAFFGCAPSSHEITSPEITSGELRQHIKYLASDELRGRKAGEEGDRLAEEYISRQFKEDGLSPAGDNGDYLQKFSFVASTKEGDKNSLNITVNGSSIQYTLNRNFKPLSFTSDTSLTAPLVFAGYGISAIDSLKYDDYAGLNVKNRIVVVLRYSPDKSPADKYSAYSSIMAKIFNARDKGASGIIFATSPPGTDGAEITSFQEPRLGNSGIAVIAMKWSDIDSLFALSGKNLKEIQQTIDTTKIPASFEFAHTSVALQAQLVKVYAQTANVVGFLSGNDSALKNEFVVIGAHFDHLGMGGEGSGSLKPDTVAIHHGADDNASGSAGLLEMAQYFSSRVQSLKRSLMFIAFSGEELGVLGSDYYVKHPYKPLEKTAAMLNMDMIGRMKDSVLVVEGMGTSKGWEEIARKENLDSLKLKLKPDGMGPSDHASFYKMNIPVFFFFTNLHTDYHKPSDTWDKINYTGEKAVVAYAARIATDVANLTEKPVFSKVALSAAQGMGGDRQGAKVSLGIIPDFAEDVPGMKISGARPGSPAEKAGLKAGDIITKFGGKDVKNIYDFTYLLGTFKPGDEVVIVVKRGEEEVQLKAVLEAKK